MSDEKVSGTVKWFSNRKGFGFITPDGATPAPDGSGSDPSEDVFVHQSSILSEGYRTLDDGWRVEFVIGIDENGRPKAETVTGPGGAPCSGPSSRRTGRRRGTPRDDDVDPLDGEESPESEEKDPADEGSPPPAEEGRRRAGRANGRQRGRGRKPAPYADGGEEVLDGGDPAAAGGRPPVYDISPTPRSDRRGRGRGGRRGEAREPVAPPVFWHAALAPAVAGTLGSRNVRLSTGTVDVFLDGTACVKLGTGGYASAATASGTVAEGTFECGPDGEASFNWESIIHFDGKGWVSAEGGLDLPVAFSLMGDNVAAVPHGHDRTALMGDGPTDPRDALEMHGFKMRRIVLIPRPRRGGGPQGGGSDVN